MSDKKKVILIGLDGGTFDIMMPYIQDGSMPTLKSLIDEGVHGILKSTFPPLTCPAWFSFSTGKNPGKLGMFNFYRLEKSSYDIRRFDNRDVENENELWDILNSYGYTTGIFNNPVAFPPKSVDGFMVSGFLAPSTHSNFTHPKNLKDDLDRVTGGYEIDADQGDRYRVEDVVENCHRLLYKRTKAIKYLLDEKMQDFMMFVYTGSDRMSHQLINKMYSDDENESRWAKEELKKYFSALDGEIGEVLDSVKNEDYTLYLMSDHGFHRRDKGFYLNQWLINEGYLVLKNPNSILGKIGITQKGIASVLDKFGMKNFVRGIVPKFLEKRVPVGVIEGSGKAIMDLIQTGGIHWQKTKAIAIPGGIYINTVDRPEGIVSPEDYDALRKEIADKLRNISDPRDGSALEVEILLREDIYSGEYVSNAPDIQFILGNYEWGEIRNIPPDGRLFDPLETAHHDDKGIFIAHGNGIRKGIKIDNANITDLAPTILSSFGIKAPDDMDGKILQDIFETPPVFSNDERNVSAQDLRKESKGYTPEEEKAIEERLRGLGYVD
ncbi:MAG: alkaline phosphatase family protein [Candidatus Marinimicrobia bacterium]|nr:alkaline phosphatase family protein [Candidatus Neomarinimicrobiota bacterium]